MRNMVRRVTTPTRTKDPNKFAVHDHALIVGGGRNKTKPIEIK